MKMILLKELVELMHDHAVDESMYGIMLQRNSSDEHKKSLEHEHKKSLEQYDQLVEAYKNAINRESQRRGKALIFS